MDLHHSFKSSFGQCACRWCGMNRFGSDYCPVSQDVRMAVRDFAKAHGRAWKGKLRSLWNSGKDEGALRRARNTIGPSNIDRITKVMLANVPTTNEKPYPCVVCGVDIGWDAPSGCCSTECVKKGQEQLSESLSQRMGPAKH